MKRTNKVFSLLLVAMCLAMPLFSAMPVLAEGTPGLAEVIDSQTTEQPTEQPATQPAATQPADTQPAGTEAYEGGMVNTGGLSSEDLRDYSGITQSEDAKNTVQSTLGQVMGWIVPILTGVIFAALTTRILLDILYLVAPFLRHKLAPNAMGDTMGEAQGMGGGGMQGGMGMGGMQGGMGMGGMQGGMGMGGMQGGMGMGGRRGMGRGGRGGMQGGMQAAPSQGVQWVSESAIQAVMTAQQLGPEGKPGNPFYVYAKSMFVPLVLVPIMLVLLLSGVLTNVGFALGDLITNAINSKI